MLKPAKKSVNYKVNIYSNLDMKEIVLHKMVLNISEQTLANLDMKEFA